MLEKKLGTKIEGPELVLSLREVNELCEYCTKHGNKTKWYLNYRNYFADKVFPKPEKRAKIEQGMMETFARTEWRYAEPKYARDLTRLRKRAREIVFQVVTLEEAVEMVKLAERAGEAQSFPDRLRVVVGHCPCVLVFRGERRYCCVGFGLPVMKSVEVGYGRLPKEGFTEFGGADWKDLRKELRKGRKVPLTSEEAEEVFREFESQGLFHLVMSRVETPLVEAICNCERQYCIGYRRRFLRGIKEFCLKGHYVAVIDQIDCTGCGKCVIECQFGAIYLSKAFTKTARVDSTRCFGCGLCRNACDQNAVKMVPREKIPIARNLW